MNEKKKQSALFSGDKSERETDSGRKNKRGSKAVAPLSQDEVTMLQDNNIGNQISPNRDWG
jgi:hypothetical protein